MATVHYSTQRIACSDLHPALHLLLQADSTPISSCLVESTTAIVHYCDNYLPCILTCIVLHSYAAG
jgi:hypothetical protein